MAVRCRGPFRWVGQLGIAYGAAFGGIAKIHVARRSVHDVRAQLDAALDRLHGVGSLSTPAHITVSGGAAAVVAGACECRRSRGVHVEPVWLVHLWHELAAPGLLEKFGLVGAV